MSRRSRRAAVLGLAALAACGGGRAARVAPLPALDPRQITLFAGLLRMADGREPDSALIIEALATNISALRAHAALAAGQVRARAVAPRLRALLADPDSAVAGSAAFALGLMRDTGAASALATQLAGAPTVGADAAWALGEIGEPARPEIERGLAIASLSSPVRARLLTVAARLRPVPVALVIPFLSNPDSAVRWAAAYAIARPYAAGGVRAVLPIARDPDREVRAIVARALSRQAAGDSLGGAALPALVDLARDANAHVRINAVRALASYQERGADAVVSALRDKDANVRVAAAQALGAGVSGNVDQWPAVWDADTSLVYQRAILTAALRRGVRLPAGGDDSSAGWRFHGDWRRRAAVADAVAVSPTGADVLRVAVPLTGDSDARVRLAAYGALAGAADTVAARSWRSRYLHAALRDTDAYVRAAAIDALAGRATAAEALLVADAYMRAAPDTGSDVRLAAVRYLVNGWSRDSVAFSDSLRRTIAALPPPNDPLVFAAALGVPIFRWKRPPHAIRPLDWYEDRVRDLVVPALAGRAPEADLITERGTIRLRLLAPDAPLTVHNFISLARARYFDGLRFHRVVPNFVAQDGDARGDGNGGPRHTIRDELNRQRYVRGAVGMALSGPDTGGSQYFLTLSPQPHLDGGYTVFAHVVAGWDAMDAVVQGDRILFVVIR